MFSKRTVKIYLAFIIGAIIILSFIWRFSLILKPGHLGDFQTSILWAKTLSQSFRNFYQITGSNYGPLYAFFLKPQNIPVNYLIARGMTETNAYWLVFHLVLILADIAIVFLFFNLVKKYFGWLWGLIAAALYAANPVFYLASGQWGQADNIVLALMLVVFWLILEKKYFWAAIIIGLGLLFKPTIIVIVPLVILLAIFDKKFFEVFCGLAVASIAGLLVSLPFFASTGQIISFYFETLIKNDLTPRLAVGAKNLWYLFGETRPDATKFIGISLKNWGNILFAVATLSAVWVFLRVKNRWNALALAFFIVLFGFYLLPTRSHERYQLFSFLPLILLCVSLRARWTALLVYLFSSITFFFVICEIYSTLLPNWIDSIKNFYNTISIANIVIFVAGTFLLCYYSLGEKRSIRKT